MYQIKLIPFNQTILYPNTSKFIIINATYYQTSTSNCKTIYNTQYCEEKDLKKITGSCIPAIIKQQPAVCTSQKITIQKEVDYFSYGKIFVQPMESDIPYTSTCKQETSRISEPTLIEFRNCTIFIDNQELSTVEFQYFGRLDVQLPYNDIVINHTSEELSLQILHNKTIKNLEHVTLLHKNITVHSASGHISLTIISLIILLIILFKIRNILLCKKKATSGLHLQPAVQSRGEKLHTPDHSILSSKLHTPDHSIL